VYELSIDVNDLAPVERFLRGLMEVWSLNNWKK
jgi:hypothetical protein